MAALVVVCDVFKSVFCEGVSVKALIFFSDLVNGFVERKTAKVGLNDFVDGDLVFFGNVIVIDGDERIYIDACSASCVMFVTHADSFL